MNLFFGYLGLGTRQDRFNAACSAVDAGYEQAPRVVQAAPPHFSALCSDAGSVLGHAEEGVVSITYVGAIPGGLPGWACAGSPLDDPDRTARHLLDLYHEKQLSFLDGVPGSYALVVTDRTVGRILLAVDPANGHSLFYRRGHDGLTYASKLGVMPMIVPGLELDRGLEDFLLGYQFLPGDRTVYAGTRSLAKGTLLEWRDGTLSEHPISSWSGPVKQDLSQATLAEAVPALHDSFMQAIEESAPSSERVAVLLGGFDSALVAAGLRRMGKMVDTFSFYFENSSYNQPHTDTLAGFSGSRHHWVPITSDTIAEGLRTYEMTFNQAAVQPHYPIESAVVCAAIRREGFMHALSGDGCDGLFLGYPTIYKRTRIIGGLSRIPKPLRKLAEQLARSPWLEKKLGHPYRVYRNVLAILAREEVVRDHFASRALDGFSLAQLRGDTPRQDRDVEEILHALAADVAGMNPVRRAYHSKALVGSNKNKMEGSMDSTGVAVTSPYAHPRFAALAASLPDELSRPGDGKGAQGKYALMQMAETNGLLPREIIEQPKRSPAEAPVDGWYNSVLRGMALEMLSELPFEIDAAYAHSLLEAKMAERLYRRYVSLDDVASHALTSLLTYAAFARAVAGARPT
jgi:asparagine synthetase B (glutamine-hydrolysing)